MSDEDKNLPANIVDFRNSENLTVDGTQDLPTLFFWYSRTKGNAKEIFEIKLGPNLIGGVNYFEFKDIVYNKLKVKNIMPSDEHGGKFECFPPKEMNDIFTEMVFDIVNKLLRK